MHLANVREAASAAHVYGKPLVGAEALRTMGEDAATGLPYVEGGRPDLPEGYDFDYLDAESLIQRLSVRDGRLILPSGVSYAALVIPARVDRLSLAVLRKLDVLVAAGGLVIGERPKGSPTRSGGATADIAWRALVDKLWSGRIRTGAVEPALRERGSPAVTGQGRDLVWTRRVLNDGEVYSSPTPATPLWMFRRRSGSPARPLSCGARTRAMASRRLSFSATAAPRSG